VNQHLLSLYNLLPVGWRSVIVSVYGYNIQHWRRPKDADKLVQEALQRDSWTQDQWKAWQQEQVTRLLHRAVTKVPFYRAYWEGRRRQGDRTPWQDLANWPVLDKESVRMNPEAFVADDCDVRRMHVEQTSGTTGTPLTTWISRDSGLQWYALHEARTRVWHNLSHQDRWGLIGGQPVVSARQTLPPFWVWNHGLRQLYLSSLHIDALSATAYLKAIREYRLQYLLGYSTSLYHLALAALESDIKLQ